MGAGRLVGAAFAIAALALVACGPTHLSALGNPGDLCTERSSCVEGSDCRITELGYRCVGRDGRTPSAEEPTPGFTAATDGAGPDTEEDTALDGEEEQIEEEEELPPTRTRRRRRGGR